MCLHAFMNTAIKRTERQHCDNSDLSLACGSTTGPAFVKPDPFDPWIKAQAGNDLLLAICLQKWFYMCNGQAIAQDKHFRKCRGKIADRRVTFPAGTRRNDSVIITSKWRRFDVIMTLLLRCVPAGYTCSLIEWIRLIGFDTSGDWYVLYGIMCIHVLHLPRTNSPSVLV